MTKLTANFSLEEFCATTHTGFLAKNLEYGKSKQGTLLELARLMEKVRRLLGDVPIIVNSAVRCPELNKAVGGSKTSQHCFDEQTEILTNNGWRLYNTITNTDKCYSYNINTNKIEIVDIEQVIIRKYIGTMFSVKTSDIDYLATDKHRFLVKTNKYIKKTTRIMRGEYHNLLKKPDWQFRTAADIYKKRSIHKVSGFINSNDEYDINLLKLAIAVICDGFVCKKKLCNKYHFGFNLAKQRKIDRVIKLLNNCNIPYTIRQDKSPNRLSRKGLPVSVLYINSTNAKPIIDLIGINKLLPYFIKTLCPDIIKQLVEEYAFFDGHIDTINNRKNFSISSVNKYNIELLQIMCISCGLKAQLTDRITYGFNKLTKIYQLNVVNKQESKISEVNHNIVQYNGIIWCVSNINQTIIIRRNGKALITGNCLCQACDFTPTNHSLEKSVEILRLYLSMWGQIILEESNGKKWIHISLGYPHRPLNKCNQVLKYDGKEYINI